MAFALASCTSGKSRCFISSQVHLCPLGGGSRAPRLETELLRVGLGAQGLGIESRAFPICARQLVNGVGFGHLLAGAGRMSCRLVFDEQGSIASAFTLA